MADQNSLTRAWQLSAIFIWVALFVRPTTASESDAIDLFNRRIVPIFQSGDPSSCVQCHLSSVDLKNYILPSSDATFVSLRDQGLIDLDAPGKSKILGLIRMGEKDLDEGSKLIHEDMRSAELAAFSAWIDACSQDPRIRDLPTSTEFARPDVPDEVIRHARKNRVVDSFVRNVWSQRMRCFPCHTPHEIDPSNPKHKGAIKNRAKLTEQYDEEMLTIFRETPEATLKYLVESSKSTPDDRLPLLNLDNPVESLLIQKPLSKLPKKKEDGTFEDPTYRFPLSHMGGLKLHPNDQTYKSFVTWIQDYARVVGGTYKSGDELPADNWHPSQLIIRIKNTPESWDVRATAQLFIHEWDSQSDQWNKDPIAFTQGTVTPRRFVNGALFLLGSNDEVRTAAWREEPALPKGRYLVKTYYDANRKIVSEPTAILNSEAFSGEVEIPNARWRKTFRFAEVVDGKKLTTTSKSEN